MPLCRSTSEWHNEFYLLGKVIFHLSWYQIWFRSGGAKEVEKKNWRKCTGTEQFFIQTIIQGETHLFNNEKIINNSKDELHLLLNCSSLPRLWSHHYFTGPLVQASPASNQNFLNLHLCMNSIFLLRNKYIKLSLARVNP